jgi:hypothetical protein
MTPEDDPGGPGAQNPTESGRTPAGRTTGARVAPVPPAPKKSEALAAALRANLARRKARVRALRNAGASDDCEE